MSTPTPPSEERSELGRNLITLAVIAVVCFLLWEQVRGFVVFAVTLGVLVAVHEWGHFIACRLTGVRVYEFAIGFGPRLATYMRRNGTDFTVRAFLIGGFVNPKGMQPDEPVTRDGLNGRRPSERALMYMGGPLLNAILGVGLLFLMGFLVGTFDDSQVLVGQVERKRPAAQMEIISGEPASPGERGLRVGDRILQVDGQEITDISQPGRLIHGKAGQAVEMTVDRGGRRLTLRGVPESKELESDFLLVKSAPPETNLTLQPGDQIDAIDGRPLHEVVKGDDPAAEVAEAIARHPGETVRLTVWREGKTRMIIEGAPGPVELSFAPAKRTVGQLGFGPVNGQGPRISLSESISNGWLMLKNFSIQISRMFSSPQRLGSNLGGPVAIWATLSEVHRLPPLIFLHLMVNLSLSLAIFNLVPIPALDGGHLIVLAVEVLRGRRLEPRQHTLVMGAGISVLLVLFAYILVKDLIKYVL